MSELTAPLLIKEEYKGAYGVLISTLFYCKMGVFKSDTNENINRILKLQVNVLFIRWKSMFEY